MWMRDNERRCVQHQIIVKKNVNVNQARTVLEGWLSSQRDLEALDVLKQRFKFEIRVCFDNLVEKHWLLSVAPGWCFIHTRFRLYLHLWRQSCNCLFQVRQAVIKVRAQGEIYDVIFQVSYSAINFLCYAETACSL